MYQNNAQKLVRLVWVQVALLALILSISRQLFTFSIGDLTQISRVLPDYLQSIVIGFRFDMRVATIAFAPFFLLGLIFAGTKLFGRLTRCIPIYSGIVYFIAAAASIGNYYYYKTYSNHFDIFIFGLVEDDTSAVLTTMWQDYPIVTSTIAAIVITAITTQLVTIAWRKIAKLTWPQRSPIITVISLVITIAIYFIFARGSIGTFPLKQYHANVSSYEVLNKVTPNALLALDWARSNHKKSDKFHSVSKDEYNQQMEKVLGQADAVYSTAHNDYLADNKPNVVFALMESMGTNLLVDDSEKTTDLLGSLRPHYQSDFHFERFLSGTDGTINSIAMMLFHSNISSLSHGSEQKTVLKETAFLPYKQAGYDIVYITGGSPLWRNLKHYLPLQGVDQFYSEEDIYEAFPEAEQYSATWGAPDKYTFKFAEQILKQSQRPVVIMIQTQTNHPPYQIPDNYQPAALKVSEKMMRKVDMDEPKARKIYETYQYANDALGDFVSEIKSSSLGENTLISASGDHRLREFSISFPEDLGTAHSVPFYLYVPESILAHTPHKYQANRIGSHRDIFPTLYAFSLSNATYTSLGGRNLLAVNDIQTPYAHNNGVTLTTTGASYGANRTVIYPWKNEHDLTVDIEGIANPTPNLDVELKKLETLYINAELKGFKAH